MVLRSICKWSLCSEVHWSIVCRTGSLKFLLSQRFLRVNWGVIFPDARALTWCSIASSLCSDFLKVSPIASAPCGFRCPLAALGVGFGRRSRCKWSPLAKARFSTEPSGTSRVGDGRRTAFWLDAWLCALPLCCQFPALFSHALKPEASVQVVVKPGVRLPGPETDQCRCARARPAALSMEVVQLTTD
jgi:hypothetical protein